MSKSSSLRRIQADIRELAQGPSDRYHAAPLENDMFEWHFTIRGADQTEFEGGVYHGRILLPPEYPFKPPHIMFLTPSGRFEVNKKVCLSFSAYHPELWQPAWGIRLILEALISFLPAPAGGSVGALNWSSEERRRLAKQSMTYCCSICGSAASLLPKIKKNASNFDGVASSSSKSSDKFATEIQKLHQLQLSNYGSQMGALPESKQKASPSTPLKSNEDVANASNTEHNQSSTASMDQKINSKVARNEKDHLSSNDSNSLTNDNTHDNQLDLNPTAKEHCVQQPSQNQMTNEPILNANSDVRPSWSTDPLIHGSIILFAAIVFLLFRKVNSLLDELQSINEIKI